jgi:hypothetical protein
MTPRTKCRPAKTADEPLNGLKIKRPLERPFVVCATQSDSKAIAT